MRRALLLIVLASCGGNSLTIEMVQQNNSGQDGIATLTEVGDTLEIRVTLARSSVEGSQTSHVHEGRCDNVGRITAGIGQMSGQLEISNKDGAAAFDAGTITFGTTLSVKLSELRDGNHVINVHDARENSLYVSCGEID